MNRVLTHAFLWTLLSVSLIPALAQAELHVQNVSWGIDGKLREEQFNVVTYTIFNNSDKKWEGDFVFQAVTRGLSKVDLPIIQQGMYIEPGGIRLLQFIVFMPDQTNYRLTWGRGIGESYEPEDDPAFTKEPIIFQLMNEAGSATKTASVHAVYESAFPVSVAGFDRVETILLDHVPRFGEARSRALKDWLYRGGTLHLFQEVGDAYPDFPPELAELNQPLDRYAVGQGTVVRHAGPINMADRNYVAENISSSKPASEPEFNDNSNYTFANWETHNKLRTMLTGLTQPAHEWWLIYIMALLYLGGIFPGCWLLGRKRGDFRVTYGALLGIVCLFSFGFRAVGARGYGERTVINSVALARPVSDGRLDVHQWSNFFVTTGGKFLIQHPAEGVVYGSGQTAEAVRGQALNRPTGLMAVDIPSFSGRSMVHAGVVKAPHPQLKLVKLTLNENSTVPQQIELEIENADEFPTSNIKLAQAVYGNQSLFLNGHKNSLSGGAPNFLGNMLRVGEWSAMANHYGQQRDPAALMENCRQLLIAKDLGIRGSFEMSEFSLPLDHLRVYLYIPMLEQFHAQVLDGASPMNALQEGYVLYSIDIPVDPATFEGKSVPAIPDNLNPNSPQFQYGQPNYGYPGLPTPVAPPVPESVEEPQVMESAETTEDSSAPQAPALPEILENPDSTPSSPPSDTPETAPQTTETP